MTSADWTGLYGLLEPFLRQGSWWLLAAPLSGFLGHSNGSSAGMKTMRPEARVHALEHDLERLRMVIRKTASMNATLSYDRVLEMVLDVSASAIANGSPEDRRLVCALLLVAGDQLEVESARGLTSTDLRVRLPGVNGAVERALAAGGLVEIEDPARDPELQRFVGLGIDAVLADMRARGEKV